MTSAGANAGRVVVVGSANTDMVLRVERRPEAGETVSGSDFQMVAGGKGANQAVAAARAGAEVTFIGAVGDDAMGEAACRGLRDEGIDVSAVAVLGEAASGVALILVEPSGENSIALGPGANAHVTPTHIEAHRDRIAAADVVLVQLEIPLETVFATAALAQSTGAKLILDPAPAVPLPSSLYRLISVLKPNAREAQLLSGVPVHDGPSAEQAARVLVDKGCGSVLVTLGADGAIWDRNSEVLRCPSEVPKVVDTTGAGDAFAGHLGAVLARGATAEDALRWATVAAGLSVTRMGAQAGVPNRAQLEATLKETGLSGEAEA